MSTPKLLSASRRSLKRGFTLVELMVTVGIFVFMTALVLGRYNLFNSNTLLTNLAYDIALTIRQAQTYGLSVRSSDSLSAYFNSPYGVDFRKVEPSKFTFFSDGNVQHSSDNTYDGTGSTGDVVINAYNLKQGSKVTGLCAGTINNCVTVNVLDVTFRRPDPTALIYAGEQGVWGSSPYSYAEITVSSGDGSSSRVIKVNQSGQISVSN